jgi:multidrug efflux pump subunit AcrA (membrane-fusion protein)
MQYKLAALSNGTIIKKLVRDGDSIQKGQLLYIVNNEAADEKYKAALKNYHLTVANLSEQSPLLKDLELALQNAALKCTNDSITYYRYKNLLAQDIGTRSNLDNVYTTYQLSMNQKRIAGQKYLLVFGYLLYSFLFPFFQIVQCILICDILERFINL